MKNVIILLLLSISISSWGQEANLYIFKNLTNKVWKAEGNWEDGTTFKQEIIFEFDLDSTIVIAKSKGFTNKEQTEYGPRNHGIRKYDEITKVIHFWEFDVFGGVTEGVVKIYDKNIVYQYEYGDSLITDMWEYVDNTTYNFIIGNYKDGEWKQKYLQTKFKGSNIE